MRPMKRVGLILFGGLVAAVLVAGLDVRLTDGRLAVENHVVQAGKAKDAVPADKDAFDPIAGSSKHVCIAFPIFSGKDANVTKDCPYGEVPNNPDTGGAIIWYLVKILKLLNLMIGGIIMLVLIIAGIQYIVSTGEPANVKNAKNRIVQAMTALLLYLMMFAILNFLVPGGILT